MENRKNMILASDIRTAFDALILVHARLSFVKSALYWADDKDINGCTDGLAEIIGDICNEIDRIEDVLEICARAATEVNHE